MLRGILPRIVAGGLTQCERDGELDGFVVELRWLGLMLSVGVARRTRWVEARDD